MTTGEQRGFSRRKFLTVSAAGGALLMTAACVPVANSGASTGETEAASAEKAQMSVATHHAAVHDYQRIFQALGGSTCRRGRSADRNGELRRDVQATTGSPSLGHAVGRGL
ncbi:MAG: twin-arginine translocation signal domain-containing protein [Caldilineaceae bacterium]